ncbi:extensin family protein [uncultured Cohaesibacter sp.]|uniref:extensin-like domain-containing protein n=1 Tax=uncultured Cohaesibacter sp. TaxID=1002546 RepID=UPI0029C70AF2|nr:extensin family protein [uncultured Cohaesibacter sp.]
MSQLTLLAVASLLAGCAGFIGGDDMDQEQLQREAILPDPAISNDFCPIVETGQNPAVALPPIDDRGGCGHPAPFLLSTIAGNQPVELSREATVNCVVISQLNRFFNDKVQPLAQSYMGEQVTGIRVAASYSCRTRNSKRGAKLSEHGKANAIDISALTLSDGTVLTVDDDWSSYGRKGRFMRAFNREACKYFTTVIGPGGDKYHQDHIHLDHGSHGRRGLWRSCQ